MSFSLGNKNPAWNLSRSAYDEVNSMPLMHNPGPILMILAGYLLFILKIGPAFMRKREAYKLTNVLAIYNALQVVLSAYLVQMLFTNLLRIGLVPRICYMDQEGIRPKILSCIWWYFIAKLTELLDTVFFVLRKKDNQVTFLHLYHHSIMLLGTWMVLKYSPSHTLIFMGLTNSFVHVVMYTYYGLAAFGSRFEKYLKWKKFITTLQLVQFVSIFFQYLVSVKTSDCPPSKGVAAGIACNTIFFLVLFLNFYTKSYTKEKNTHMNGYNTSGKTKTEILLSEKTAEHQKMN